MKMVKIEGEVEQVVCLHMDLKMNLRLLIWIKVKQFSWQDEDQKLILWQIVLP